MDSATLGPMRLTKLVLVLVITVIVVSVLAVIAGSWLADWLTPTNTVARPPL